MENMKLNFTRDVIHFKVEPNKAIFVQHSIQIERTDVSNNQQDKYLHPPIIWSHRIKYCVLCYLWFCVVYLCKIRYVNWKRLKNEIRNPNFYLFIYFKSAFRSGTGLSGWPNVLLLIFSTMQLYKLKSLTDQYTILYGMKSTTRGVSRKRKIWVNLSCGKD